MFGSVMDILDRLPILPRRDLSQRDRRWRRKFEGKLWLNIIDVAESGFPFHRFVARVTIFFSVDGRWKIHR